MSWLQKGQTLIAKKHEASPEIRSRLQNLEQKWKELIRASLERGKVLEEAKDILAFNEEVDKVEAWIRDKVNICGKSTHTHSHTHTYIYIYPHCVIEHTVMYLAACNY